MKFALALALGSLTFFGSAAAQDRAGDRLLPYVSVAPRFVDGVHTSCDIRFLVRLGLDQGLGDRLASGTAGLWLVDGDLAFLLKVGFPTIGDESAIPPQTAYLISDYTTNVEDFLTSHKSVDGGYLISGFDGGMATLSKLVELGDETRRVTIGFTTSDGSSSQFAFDLSGDRAETWSGCRDALLAAWSAAVTSADETAGDADAAADAAAAAIEEPEPSTR